VLHDSIKDCQETKEKVWGKEFWIVNNENYCGKVLVLNQQHRCSIHYHKLKKETFFVVSGKILLECALEKKLVLTPGMSVTIEQYQGHRFTGLAPISEIVEFSSQHFEHDSYREKPSGKVSDEEWKEMQNEY
jgi:mannose-6-phosphate isomerase-like protein (cupin superfamily)